MYEANGGGAKRRGVWEIKSNLFIKNKGDDQRYLVTKEKLQEKSEKAQESVNSAVIRSIILGKQPEEEEQHHEEQNLDLIVQFSIVSFNPGKVPIAKAKIVDEMDIFWPKILATMDKATIRFTVKILAPMVDLGEIDTSVLNLKEARESKHAVTSSGEMKIAVSNLKGSCGEIEKICDKTSSGETEKIRQKTSCGEIEKTCDETSSGELKIAVSDLKGSSGEMKIAVSDLKGSCGEIEKIGDKTSSGELKVAVSD
ncbi:hypothetical protein FXO38_34855 [Capsicum annuum]|nr:hypothetical protein FXO38_34855 [Capsicum annuum]KAF3629080.1 hypothetical protein FXO37_29085 [Capsicum annuum]